jgi:hypothetical protein
MTRIGYTGGRRDKGGKGCMRDTRVFYVHGEVSLYSFGE